MKLNIKRMIYLRAKGNDNTETAKILGVHRVTVSNKMSKFKKMSDEEFKKILDEEFGEWYNG